MARIGLIVTVLHEESTIQDLLESIEKQTRLPDEIIIVDGGSTDFTQKILARWNPPCAFRWLVKKGNRSVGRNEAIVQLKSEIVAITDAGCILDPHWLEMITSPLLNNTAEVVAGYYKPNALTAFQQGAAAYMLVMPKNITPFMQFLPATRSMALMRNAWEKAGRFNEKLSDNEDYVFAQSLKKIGARMTFVPEAIVFWTPPKTWQAFLTQIYRFAYGDSVAGIFRPKVAFIFLRYMFFILLGIFNFYWLLNIVLIYAFWARQKNNAYVTSIHSLYILPAMQFATDIVVMYGTIRGMLQKVLT